MAAGTGSACPGAEGTRSWEVMGPAGSLPPSILPPLSHPQSCSQSCSWFLGCFAKDMRLVQARVWEGGRVWDGDAAGGAGQPLGRESGASMMIWEVLRDAGSLFLMADAAQAVTPAQGTAEAGFSVLLVCLSVCLSVPSDAFKTPQPDEAGEIRAAKFLQE